jgi:protein associated with RNAse G/E
MIIIIVTAVETSNLTNSGVFTCSFKGMNVTVTIYDEGIIFSAELVNTFPVQGKLVDYFQLHLVLFAQK